MSAGAVVLWARLHGLKSVVVLKTRAARRTDSFHSSDPLHGSSFHGVFSRCLQEEVRAAGPGGGGVASGLRRRPAGDFLGIAGAWCVWRRRLWALDGFPAGLTPCSAARHASAWDGLTPAPPRPGSPGGASSVASWGRVRGAQAPDFGLPVGRDAGAGLPGPLRSPGPAVSVPRPVSLPLTPLPHRSRTSSVPGEHGDGPFTRPGHIAHRHGAPWPPHAVGLLPPVTAFSVSLSRQEVRCETRSARAPGPPRAPRALAGAAFGQDLWGVRWFIHSKAKHSDRPESPLSSVEVVAAACEAPHGPAAERGRAREVGRGRPLRRLARAS